MKEAAGEANMTVVTIILIGVVAAIASPIVTNVINNAEKRSCCVNDGAQWLDGSCSNGKTYKKGCSKK